MRRPLIALLTDFGTADHYVASVKGVLLGRCPTATLVDITHEVPPQDVLAGALLIESCWRDFPRGTVLLGVVDPGVGSARRALAAEADGRRFVGPDNGLFSLAWAAARSCRVVALGARPSPRGPGAGAPGGTGSGPSRTFEGRDRFAPAAARLARGLPIDVLGRVVRDPVRVAMPSAAVKGHRLVGEVIHVDRFGNLVTNLLATDLARWSGAGGGRVSLGRRRLGRLVGTYADVEPGQACALIGSTGRLEIAVRNGDAARTFRAEKGQAVAVGGR